MPSIKKNFVYNVSITLANYIAGLLVFPYVSRCLGVELIGQTSFAVNVVSYFSLFALLGVVTVGTREIAGCKNDDNKRSNVFSSVFTIILILTGISFLLMTASIFIIPKFGEYKQLLLIGSISLVFTSLQIEWLYQGIEQFDYIAIRSILIRVLYCTSVFLFIKGKDDYLLYYILTVAQTVLNGLVNLLYSRHFVKFSFKNVQVKAYLKPIVSYGVNKLLISMYTTFNVLYLGFVCTDTEVGYYSTANKLFGILLGVITAFTYVILPRMSSLLSNNNIEEFHHKINQSFDVILSLAIPISIGGVMMAPQIVRILAGGGYEGAIIPMQIIMPVIILTGISQICIMQVLIPMKKDNAVLFASVIGAIVGVAANIVLVGKAGAIGSALVLLLSELGSTIYCFIYAIKNKIIIFPWRMVCKQFLLGLPYVLYCGFVNKLDISSPIATLGLSVLLCGIHFLLTNFVFRKDSEISKIFGHSFRLK